MVRTPSAAPPGCAEVRDGAVIGVAVSSLTEKLFCAMFVPSQEATIEQISDNVG